MKSHHLVISWGTSRGHETYGYTLATLREHGHVMARQCGGGYDMRGAAFADWLNKVYGSRYFDLDLSARDGQGKRLTGASGPTPYYGLYSWIDSKTGKEKRAINGACGFSTVCNLAAAIGLEVLLIDAGKKTDIITVTDTREENE